MFLEFSSASVASESGCMWRPLIFGICRYCSRQAARQLQWRPTREATATGVLGRPARTASFRHRSINRNSAVAIRLQLLQRLALDAGNNAAHQPARLAHLDDHPQELRSDQTRLGFG